MSNQLDQLAEHLDRIALIITERPVLGHWPHMRAHLDARFLVIAADALRNLGGQVLEIAKLGHELKGLSEGKPAEGGK